MRTQAYVALKQLLIGGPVAAGACLSERRLAKQWGMSNTPVRSVLERLEAEGFIAISPQQGIEKRHLPHPVFPSLPPDRGVLWDHDPRPAPSR